MRRYLLAALALLFTLLLTCAAGTPANAVDTGQYGIQPSDEADYFHINLAPGSTIDKTAILTNHTGVAVRMQTYAVDGHTTPQGGFGFAAEHDRRTSVGAWSSLSSTTVLVPAHGQATLPFHLTVPANAPPGDYYGGIVMQAPPVAGQTVTMQGGTAVQLNIIQRQAVRVYLTVAGTRRNALRLGAPSWTHAGPGVRFYVTVRNTGNTVLHPSGTLTLRSRVGVNQRLRLNTPESLLPGETVTVHAALPNTPLAQAGALTVTERSEAGSQTRTGSFVIIPWGFVIGAFLTLLLLIYAAFRVIRFTIRARRALARLETLGTTER